MAVLIGAHGSQPAVGANPQDGQLVVVVGRQNDTVAPGASVVFAEEQVGATLSFLGALIRPPVTRLLIERCRERAAFHLDNIAERNQVGESGRKLNVERALPGSAAIGGTADHNRQDLFAEPDSAPARCKHDEIAVVCSPRRDVHAV
jgi:hypothetical protein